MSPRRAVPVGSTIAAVVALTAAQLLRTPRARTWNTIWAEDGLVYVQETLAHPWPDTVFRGYAGYAQALPRLLAAPVRLLPPGSWSAYLATTASVVTALLAVSVYRSARSWVQWTPLRALLAVAVALAPAAHFEVNANLANLGWPLLIASAWALASREDGPVDVAVRVGVVAVTALSTTVAVLLAPVALAVALVRRRPAAWWVAAAFGVALAVQVFADRFIHQAPRGASRAGDLPAVYAVRVLGSFGVGERWLPELWDRLAGWFVVGLVAGAVAFAVVAAVHRLPADRIWFAVAAVVLSVAFLVVPAVIRGTAELRVVAGQLDRAGSRYVVVPVALLVSAAVVLADASHRRWLRYVVLAHGALVIVTSYGLVAPRSLGPTWSGELPAARAACDRGAGPSFATVQTTPDIPGWHIEVPCGRLR